MKAVFVVILLLVSAAPVCYAEIYEYTDSNGVVHFTDDPSKVPASKRKSRNTPSLTSSEAKPVESTIKLENKPTVAQESPYCGQQPLPKLGCRIGRCINGDWEQICESPQSPCGQQPLPKLGCRIGRCINGHWEQICESPQSPCGLKPLPKLGCRIGRCINGHWEELCN